MAEEILADDKAGDASLSKEDLPELSVKKCHNCEAVLTDSFCSSCGQKDFNILRPFWALVEDTLGDLFAFDSRFFGTLVLLMFRPGYITREFNRGRRVKFVPPFRQYLVISVIFFLLLVTIDIQLLDTNSITVNQGEGFTIDSATPENKEQSPDQLLDRVIGEISQAEEENKSEGDIAADANLYEYAIAAVEGAKKVLENPTLLNVIIADWIPKMMFLLLPLFALFLKIFYIRRKKFYIEHLVFSLHYHAFLFLFFTLMLLFNHFVPAPPIYLAYSLYYIPIYLVIAMWTVYKQGIIKTFIKAALLSFTYLTFMSIGLVTAIVWGLTKV